MLKSSCIVSYNMRVGIKVTVRVLYSESIRINRVPITAAHLRVAGKWTAE